MGPHEVRIRFHNAGPLVRQVTGQHGNLVTGLPPRYVVGKREVAECLLTGALAASPVVSTTRGWRVNCPTAERSLAMVGLLRRCGVDSRVVSSRAGRHAVAIARSEAARLLEFAPLLPEVRHRTPRGSTGQGTLDEINALRRSDQAERTRWALETLGDHCPAPMRTAAELRLAFPERSVDALAAMMDPPTSRHAINGQLRRLHQLAQRRV